MCIVSKKKSSGKFEEVIGKVPELDLNIYGLGVVESGIRNLVSALWTRKYLTVCSCAGHLGALEPLPWVAILIDKSDPCHLLRLFSAIGRFNLSLGKNGRLPRPDDIWVLAPQMTVAGLAVYLRPHFLNEKNSQKEIDRLRQLGEKLASFMEEKCEDIFPPC